MMIALHVIHWLAAIVVLAEALNKVERTAPFAPGLTWHARFTDGLKALAWVLLALGAAGELAAPLLASLGVPDSIFLIAPEPTLTQTAVLAGFAVLIVRTRVKEG